jgi:hypothetical protein
MRQSYIGEPARRGAVLIPGAWESPSIEAGAYHILCFNRILGDATRA